MVGGTAWLIPAWTACQDKLPFATIRMHTVLKSKTGPEWLKDMSGPRWRKLTFKLSFEGCEELSLLSEPGRIMGNSQDRKKY